MNANENKKITTNRCIRFPEEIMLKIQQSAEKETRTFSAQVIHIIKKYYELQERK